ncbi:transposable element Tc1 transposase [Trichonephila clavipes]|uniref:Transposable element Tc1 transposase n=1 Tax=Trichonephila clavipes TaxID=2585209 RepID=A0A8X6R3R1_TRICX|nr:transposable element Tc1 transposase [Trichonephila clavipes]
MVGRLCVPLEIVGRSGHEKVPACGNRVWSDQEDLEERVSKNSGASTCGPHSDSFNHTSRRRCSNCCTNKFQNLAEANLKSKRPFRALPLTPEHRNCVYSGAKPDQCGMSQIGKSLSTLIVMHGILTGQRYVDDILRPQVAPFLNGLPGAIFQQDNARPHTARVAQDFLRHFQTLPRPARSPNLSPVEHV